MGGERGPSRGGGPEEPRREGHLWGGRGECDGESSGGGGADEENVVATSASDFERAFGGLLAVNFTEVDTVFRGFAEEELRIDLNRGERFGGVDEVDGLGQRFYRVDFDALDDGRFAR